MIESSLAFGTSPQNPDAGYKNWQTSLLATRTRQQGYMRYDLNDRTAGPMPTFGSMVHQDSAATLNHAYASAYTGTGTHRPDIAYEAIKGDNVYSFGDVIDMVNPLQHLPVIGTIYRKISGDTIKPMSQIVGGTLFGGPVGAVASTVNAIVKDRTGKDLTENAFALADIDVTTPAERADIAYLEPIQGDLPGTTLAVANLSVARDGRQNFAASKSPATTWNS